LRTATGSGDDLCTNMVFSVAPAITGLQLLNSLKTFEPFSTGHRQIDCQLWSRPLKRNRSDSPIPYPPLTGLSRRQHLQVEGPPGSGKTKFVIGLAVRARTASLVRYGSNEAVEVLLIGESPEKSKKKTRITFLILLKYLKIILNSGAWLHCFVGVYMWNRLRWKFTS
jgi:hypothetical protein